MSNNFPVKNNRLILGTAQLGMVYGVANRTGQPSGEIAREIISKAVHDGVLFFDTAQAYGNSEQILAQSLTKLGCLDKAQVFTKIAPKIDHSDSGAVSLAIKESWKLFGPSFYCCMLHSEELLSKWDYGLGETLIRCRDKDMFRHIGISVYNPDAAKKALLTEGVDFVQLPANILDRRHEEAGVMDLALELGKRIVIRSVYLQGALLLPLDGIPESVKHLRSYIEALIGIAAQYNLSTREAALQFVCKRWANCMVTFGAELPEQVRETISSWGQPISHEAYTALEKQGTHIPLEVIRPDLW